MIPIVDNVRIDYLIHCVAKQEKSVLLIGEQGVGKTVMMKSYMKRANPEQYLSRSFNFSSATTPYQFQVGVNYKPVFVSLLQYRKWLTYCEYNFQFVANSIFINPIHKVNY